MIILHPQTKARTIPGLGGGFEYLFFSPLFGEDFQFDEHIFQMGGVWLNLPAWSPVPAERAELSIGQCHGGHSTVWDTWGRWSTEQL